jgi:hypothetical protein
MCAFADEFGTFRASCMIFDDDLDRYFAGDSVGTHEVDRSSLQSPRVEVDASDACFDDAADQWCGR